MVDLSDEVIDLRSDTVTLPTDAMRAAMAAAEVGDDGYREDPTVLRLEETGADLLGKQSALFFPSGTMANQVAIHLHTRPGDEVLLESLGHSFDWELSGAAVISSVQLRPIKGDAGVLTARHIAPHLSPRTALQARISLLILENTHNMSGGRVVPIEILEDAAAEAREAGLRVHLDGARLFNAAVASGDSAAALAAPFDTAMISLSKGLSAPAGSLLAGDSATIREARRVRKMLGGGMRQIGVLAAAGLVALEHGIDRLAEDHANARRLADGLLQSSRVTLAYGHVDTNVVVINVAGTSAVEFAAVAAERGVHVGLTASGSNRLLLHRHVTATHVDEALGRLAPVLAG